MIRLAKNQDVSRIAEIHIFGWRSAYRDLISDEYLFSNLSVSKRINSLSTVKEQNNEETYVFEDSGIIKAFMILGNSRNVDKPNSYELYALYVEPLMKGQGIGTQMISEFESIAHSKGFKETILWVFKNNKSARSFYEKNGYLCDGKEKTIEKFAQIEIRYLKQV